LLKRYKGDIPMIRKIKKILYATDLSETANHAYLYAVDLAKKYDAEIVALHVLEEIPPTTRTLFDTVVDEGRFQKTLKDRVSHSTKQVRDQLKALCDRELKGDTECMDRMVSIEVCEGHPEDHILKKVEELKCDTIVMGTHAKGIFKGTVGSVTRRVLRQVKKPVFVTPMVEEE
jgi:nucleotide-binding universal stress UspA family protein